MKNIKLLLIIPLITSYGSVCPSASAGAGAGSSYSAATGKTKRETGKRKRLSDEKGEKTPFGSVCPSASAGAGAGSGSRSSSSAVCAASLPDKFHIDKEEARAKREQLTPEKQAELNEKLKQASQRGDVQSAYDAIMEGAALDREYEFGKTALIWATIMNRPQIQEFLIAAGAKIDQVNILGDTALMMAVLNNCPKSVKFLIAAGANVALATHFGYTALLWAAQYNMHEIVQMLIDANADPTIADPNGRYAHQLVPVGDTDEEITRNTALQTKLEKYYDQWANPCLK